MSESENGPKPPEQPQTKLDLEAETQPIEEKSSGETTGPDDEIKSEPSTPEEEEEDRDGQEDDKPDQVENPVVELANTGGGYWKILRDGEKVELSDPEWRIEINRIFSNDLTDK